MQSYSYEHLQEAEPADLKTDEVTTSASQIDGDVAYYWKINIG